MTEMAAGNDSGHLDGYVETPSGAARRERAFIGVDRASSGEGCYLGLTILSPHAR
jgi:hypothetical protein